VIISVSGKRRSRLRDREILRLRFTGPGIPLGCAVKPHPRFLVSTPRRHHRPTETDCTGAAKVGKFPVQFRIRAAVGEVLNQLRVRRGSRGCLAVDPRWFAGRHEAGEGFKVTPNSIISWEPEGRAALSVSLSLSLGFNILTSPLTRLEILRVTFGMALADGVRRCSLNFGHGFSFSRVPRRGQTSSFFATSSLDDR